MMNIQADAAPLESLALGRMGRRMDSSSRIWVPAKWSASSSSMRTAYETER